MRLAARISLAMAALVLAAVVVLALFGRQAASRGLGHFLALEEETVREAGAGVASSLARRIEGSFRVDGDFRRAGTDIERFAEADSRGFGIALFDAAGRLVAGRGLPAGEPRAELTPEGLLRVNWTTAGRELVLQGGDPITDAGGRRVGTLLLTPPLTAGEAARRQAFAGVVDRRLLLAAIVVALLAAAAGATLARRIVRPVAELEEASRALGAGDLSRRVEVHSSDEIGRLGHSFNAMAGELERTERLRRQLVHDVAHELRTPLTALQGQLETLQDGLAEPSAESLASLHEEVIHLAALVDDLQEMALAEAGQLVLDLEILNLADEVTAAVRSLGLVDGVDAAGAPTIELDLPDRLPPVLADRRRLRQILSNLLDNARRHGASASGAARIRVSARHRDERIEVAVADRGPGIPERHLPHLFERFYRSDPSRQRSTGGAGLGLAIVRQLVELHVGHVEAESPSEGGSVFRFTLPVAVPTEELPPLTDEIVRATIERTRR